MTVSGYYVWFRKVTAMAYQNCQFRCVLYEVVI